MQFGFMKKIFLALLFFIFVITVFFFFIDIKFSINGTIIDEDTEKPIPEAHIIVFTYYYPLPEIINVGGPNSAFESIKIFQANDNGNFEIPAEFKLFIGFNRYREIYFYKKGYFSDKFKQTNNSNFIRNAFNKSHKIFKNLKTIPLSKSSTQRDKHVIIGILWNAYSLTSNIKRINTSKFKNIRPTVIKLRNLFLKDSKEIMLFLEDDISIKKYKGILKDLETLLLNDLDWFYDRFGRDSDEYKNKMNIDSFSREEYEHMIAKVLKKMDIDPFSLEAQELMAENLTLILALHYTLLKDYTNNPDSKKYIDLKKELCKSQNLKLIYELFGRREFLYRLIPYIPKHVFEDETNVKNLALLKYSTRKIKDKKKVVIEVVSKDGLELKYASERLRNDKEVVKAAVTQNGKALTYASDRLKDDKEIVKAAVNQDKTALNHTFLRLENDEEVVSTDYASYKSKSNIIPKKVIFTSGLDENKQPIDELTVASINMPKIFIYVNWELDLKKHEAITRIYDATGRLVYAHGYNFTPSTTSWNTWVWYEIKKHIDQPGTWKFKVNMDGKNYVDENLDFTP